MKINLLSDLHLEFMPMQHVVPVEADVVIMAGDIHPGVRGIIWAYENIGIPTVMVAGNHEFYGKRILQKHYPKMQAKTDEMNKLAGDVRYHFLQDKTIVIDGVRFIGTTLWTDFNLNNNQPMDMMYAQQVMNDYYEIHQADDKIPQGKKLSPHTVLTEHHIARHFIRSELEKPFDGKTVVVTHHGPTELSIDSDFKAERSNAFYVSRLENLIFEFEPVLWVHGHVHRSVNYKIGDTRIITNPRGYPVGFGPMHQMENENFDPDILIEI